MENPIIENSASESKTPETAPHSTPAPSQISQLTNICAAGLLVSFFLPWVQLFGLKASLFEAAKRGSTNSLYWSLPIFCMLTVIAGVVRNNQRIVAQVSGAIPFFIVGHALYRQGTDVLDLLAVGAWIAMGLGLVLFVLARRLK